MSDKHLIAVSVENHAYHGWQAATLAYSALQWQKTAPLLVVHGADQAPLHPFLEEAQAAGAWVLHARNWKDHGRHERPWAARNTAAALLDAAALARELGAETVVLLDPDMVWTRRVSWPSELAVDHCPLEWIHQDRARAVARRMGLSVPADAHVRFGARVPYVVPTALAGSLGVTWWRVMEHYYELGDWRWSDHMVAFALALLELGLKPAHRRFSQTNGAGGYKAPVEAPLIHYAHGTPYWDKRWFVNEDSPAWAELWKPPRLPVDSVQGWVSREIWRTRRFYDRLKGETKPVSNWHRRHRCEVT